MEILKEDCPGYARIHTRSRLFFPHFPPFLHSFAEEAQDAFLTFHLLYRHYLLWKRGAHQLNAEVDVEQPVPYSGYRPLSRVLSAETAI